MPKTFYTERDIVDLANRGVTSLEVNDDVVLTDNARDTALKRGMRLIRANPAHPEDDGNAELAHRVKAAVIARLGDQVDAKLLDSVVSKVVSGLK
ncbi:MAG: hypothetical protein HW378_2100 [Anaerolineales bacterium]|nr:hypothetical protein [Anaerolineales bacterium]